jgi:guanylate kinase
MIQDSLASPLPTSRRGVLFVLSSPSGAGKSTLTRLLMQSDLEIRLSVSITTRARRSSEVNGVHYTFVSEPEFLSLRDRGELLEWAHVHGNYYGTPRRAVEERLKSGVDTLFDIDWQGARQVVEAFRSDAVTVFVLPPSLEELQRRLERRAEDPPDVIAKRLENAHTEIAHWQSYDYVLINDDLEKTYGDITAILRAARLERNRCLDWAARIQTMLAA